MIEDQQLMEELLKWITVNENVILEKEKDPIPEEDYEEVNVVQFVIVFVVQLNWINNFNMWNMTNSDCETNILLHLISLMQAF